MKKVSIGNCILYQGNCENIIKLIEDKSISLIHTDPPYLIHSGVQNSKMFEDKGINKQQFKLDNADISNGYNINIMLPEFERICKTINFQIWCSKKQFIDYLILAKNNKWNWQDICLYRNNALPNVRGKYQDKDYCVHLWKGRTLTGTYHQKVTDYHWNIGGKKEWNHPALKPIEPIINLIQVGSDEKDIVLDPFMGSGTTGEACLRTSRYFVGIEREEKYFEMTCERLSKVWKEINGSE